ncbi:hypothetical protein FRC00_007646 [Tulasnella sp. 408]|nr:hypothetical protein FRC00_007646 [Tulasnella sp. 408]
MPPDERPFNWAIFPPPNPQFPRYYPSDFYTAYIRSTNVSPSTPYAADASTSSVTTPLTAAGGAGVQQLTQSERPLTKKERQAKAKLEAKENQMAEVEAKFRLWQEEEEKKAQKEAEEAERLRMAEEEWSERKEERRLRKLNEEIRKGWARKLRGGKKTL